MLNSKMSSAQWVQPLGNNGDLGTLSVFTSESSVSGTFPSGFAYYGTNDIIQAANNGWIANTLNANGPSSRFKATAGKPINIVLSSLI